MAMVIRGYSMKAVVRIVVKNNSQLMSNIKLIKYPPKEPTPAQQDLDAGIQVNTFAQRGEGEEGIQGPAGGVVA